MSQSSIVGLSGNFARPSKTRILVEHVCELAAGQLGSGFSSFDLDDLGPSFTTARWSTQLDGQAKAVIEAITEAELLVVGSPTYKGSYTGLFKHFFDLLDPRSLRGKPVILLATGGGERHALMVEHQLRPLFGFFEAHALPTAVYAAEADFSEGRLVAEPILRRAAFAVEDAVRFLNISTHATRQIAAE